MNQKLFWPVLIVMAIFVNENLVQWMLAIFVGGMGVADGFEDVFRHFTLEGYLFFSLIRVIPYALLAIVVLLSIKKDRWSVTGIAWGGLLAIVLTITYLSWVSLEPLYTDAHASSTTALAFLVIPFFAVATGAIGSLAGAMLIYIKRTVAGVRAG